MKIPQTVDGASQPRDLKQKARLRKESGLFIGITVGMLKKKLQSDIALLREITQEENKPRLAPSVQKAFEEKPTKKKDQPKKNHTAGALGRFGGLKSSKARIKKLSAKRQTEIARRSFKERWKYS